MKNLSRNLCWFYAIMLLVCARAIATVAPPLPPVAGVGNGIWTVGLAQYLRVTWLPESGVGITYEVLRSSDGGKTYAVLASGITGTSYVDTSASLKQSYGYEVEAQETVASAPTATAYTAPTTQPTAQPSSLVSPGALPHQQAAVAGVDVTTVARQPITSIQPSNFALASGAQVWYVDFTAGLDTNPGTQAAPCKTVGHLIGGKAGAGAIAIQSRGDHILIKRGGTDNETITFQSTGGSDAGHVFLVSSYGSGAKPVVAGGFGFTSGSHIAVQFVDAVGACNSSGVPTGSQGFTSASSGLSDITIEGCKAANWQFDSIGLTCSGCSDLVIRLCTISGNWNVTSQHSEGLFPQGWNGIEIVHNVFDHCGWNPNNPSAPATIYNHGLYEFDQALAQRIVRYNLFYFCAAQGAEVRGGGDLSDNVFVGNGLPGFVGINPSTMYGNIVEQGRNIDANDAGGNGLKDLACATCDIEYNVCHAQGAGITGQPAFEVAPTCSSDTSSTTLYGGSGITATISNNFVPANWNGPFLLVDQGQTSLTAGAPLFTLGASQITQSGNVTTGADPGDLDTFAATQGYANGAAWVAAREASDPSNASSALDVEAYRQWYFGKLGITTPE